MRVTFYHSVRADGGHRTGLDINDSKGLERYTECPDPDESDPVLRWYVDVTWDVADPPRSQEEARAWYAARLPELRRVLMETADRLRAGVDKEWDLARFTVPTADGDATVAVSAQRHFDGVGVAAGIRAALATEVDALAVEEVACATG